MISFTFNTAPKKVSANVRKPDFVQCQLLNPIAADAVAGYLSDDSFCAQEKMDGRRLLMRVDGGECTAYNRQGMEIKPDSSIKDAVERLGCDVLIDGENVGGVFHAFDILEDASGCIRHLPFKERFARLEAMYLEDPIKLVPVLTGSEDKESLLFCVRKEGGEGVVFKDLEAPHTGGRPYESGPQVKFKFYETASFIVTGKNKRRSISIGLVEGSAAGNVAIPAPLEIPALGSIVEVRYLYAFRESGSIFQPYYLGERDDIPESDCTVRQLKFKD